ncbi:MAG: SDR family oxidoreductase [Alphaproteobacteria bacterium]|nr:SDR family oxidoreductase [Alphaproteobacteria bacterium]
MKKKIALVTLATGYGGPSAVKALLAGGWKVFCNDRGFSDTKQCKAFAKANPKVKILDALEPEKAVGAVVKQAGRIDLLFSNNFVPLYPSAVETAALDVYRDYLEGLTIEPFRAARAAVPHMKKQKSGKIVFMTSAGPMKGLPNLSTYCAARGGATALMKALAQEVGRFNIQVNAIGPNYAENPTYFPKHILGKPFMRKLIKEECPIERYATPEEMVALIAFLAKEESNFITSQLIPFCGGWAS